MWGKLPMLKPMSTTWRARETKGVSDVDCDIGLEELKINKAIASCNQPSAT